VGGGRVSLPSLFAQRLVILARSARISCNLCLTRPLMLRFTHRCRGACTFCASLSACSCASS